MLIVTEFDYFQIENDIAFVRTKVDHLYHEHLELFPVTFAKGDIFNRKTASSVKLAYRLRRIQLKIGKAPFTLAPAFIRPWMTAQSANVEKTLFLRCFNNFFQSIFLKVVVPWKSSFETDEP